MDLNDLTPKSDVIEVTLKHPNTGKTLKNDDGTKMTITLHAPHSKPYKSAIHEQTNKQLKKARGSNKIDVTAEELELSTLELLVRATKEWNITYKGKIPPVSDAAEVYETVFWIKDQIEGELNSTLDFTKA
ncbi:hypothetical protein N9060_01245, partial [Arenicella sp.]|jgi:hypothetical protein|nr:hypothetical protein [Arenicella sp.]